MEFDHSRLAGRIIEKFGTRRNFADAVGLPASSVTGKLNNKIRISAEEMYLWSSADLLNIPLEQIGDFFFVPKFH